MYWRGELYWKPTHVWKRKATAIVSLDFISQQLLLQQQTLACNKKETVLFVAFFKEN